MLENARLLRPLNYLRINGEGLTFYNWFCPVLFSSAACSYLFLYPGEVRISGETQTVLGQLASLLAVLPGFYIAALAAVATFQRDIMDMELSGNSVSLKAQENGCLKERNLTRRRFLCYLFGYLSFLSFALFLAVSLLQVASPTAFLASFNGPFVLYADWAILGIFMLFFCQLISVTMLGLFYLADRMHWRGPDIKIE